MFSARLRPLRQCLLLLALALPLSPTLASDHGGASGPEPLKFTVNLGAANSSGRYLQLEIMLETGSPEAAHSLGTLKPKIQNAIILLLSGEEEGKLRTLEGKRALADKIQSTINKLIDESEKTGIKEVLFTNFIIQ
ncbi:MAG: hypothetical protein RIR00_1889 [Pseudomonadota bacterium]|jgi:flagellar FliL protein